MAAQTQVVFNDNAAKLMLIALTQFPGVLAHGRVALATSILSALLVAPFVLFAPMAGWLSDRYSKWAVLNFSLGLQAVGMTLLVLTLWLRSHSGALGCFCLLAVQATIFAPAKRGVLKEMVGSTKLSLAVGWMEMLGVAAILVGGYGGGRMFDLWTAPTGDPWHGALITAIVLAFLSVGSWLFFQLVGRTPAQSAEPYRADLWWRHGPQLRELWRSRPLFRSGMGVTFFYLMGGLVYLIIIQIGREMHGGGVGSGTEAGHLLVLLGLGTVLGNFSAGLISRKGIELGLVPIGVFGMAGALVLSGAPELRTGLLYFGLVLAGVAAGLFLVPLYAYIQDKAGDRRRGRVLASVGVLDSLGGLAAAGLYALMAAGLHWRARHQLLMLSIPCVLVGLYALWRVPEGVVHLAHRLARRVFLRVRVSGAENLPAGGALFVGVQASCREALLLPLACPRKPLVLAFDAAGLSAGRRTLWGLAGVQVLPARGRPGLAERFAARQAAGGAWVALLPAPCAARCLLHGRFAQAALRVARRASRPVVPLIIDRRWGPLFWFSGQKSVWRRPLRLLHLRQVRFGAPLIPEKTEAAAVRSALQDLSEAALSARPELERHLGRECVRSLSRRPWQTVLIDRTAERRALTASRLLAVAAALSRRLRHAVPERRVGIVLPPGAGAALANLAVVCAGKIPVNLNFTTGRAAALASLKLGEISTVISAAAMRQKIPDFPWPEKTLDVREEILACGKPALLTWLAAAWLLPGRWMAFWLELPHTGGREEAALLFTSGSAGEPKGVALSHRNILANCAQISATGLLPKVESLLACLPVFHSFGFTVTLWYPLLRGCRIATVPSPLETARIAAVIAEEKVSVLIGAPTFLRPFLKKAERAELAPLHLVVSGAERMPLALYEGFRERFGRDVLQGYGLTETSPVTNVNLAGDPRHPLPAGCPGGGRLGSVGRLAAGMSARLVDPDTGADLPLTARGVLLLRGANVFAGYLHDPEKTRAALRDGWFVTADLARFDDDGFLFIEGRLSRFSKIGGEMVPHVTVEQALSDAFGWDQGEGPVAAVVGVPDPARGESLVLLTTVAVTLEEVREKIATAGLPNLWAPRVIRRVAKIPLLGSGKCDLQGCRQLAQAAE